MLAAALRGLAAPTGAAAMDPKAVIERVRLHGIAGLLVAREGAMAGWPVALQEAIGREARLRHLWEDTHCEILFPLLKAFEAVEVEVLVLKGTALAYSLYPDPAVRARGDSDLMVRPAALSRARTVLAAEGFSRHTGSDEQAHQEVWEKASDFGLTHAVDLHWRSHPRPAMAALLPVEDLFASSAPLSALPGLARRPGWAQMLVACAINQAAHRANGYVLEGRWRLGETRLGWIWDVDLLARTMSEADWAALVRLTREKGIARAIAGILRSSRDTLGTRVPEEVLAALDEQAGEDVLLAYFDPPTPFAKARLDLAAARGPDERWRALSMHLLPDGETLRGLRPDYPDWPLPLLRLRRIAGAALRHVWGNR